MPYEVKEPPWIAELPRLRNQPVPSWNDMAAPAAVIPGRPSNCPTRSAALILRRRCGICGCKLGKTVERVFHQAPGYRDQQPQWPGGLITSGPLGPTHKSCTIYSSLICPILHSESARSRYAGYTRGPAAIESFSGYGIAAFPEATALTGGAYVVAYYGQVGYSIPFGRCKELFPLYEKAITDDSEFIDTDTRLYWDDSSSDENRLLQCARADEARIAAAPAQSRVYVDGYFGGHAYPIALPYEDDR